MRDLVHAYISRNVDRRGFLKGMATAGFTVAAAESVLAALAPMVEAAEMPPAGKFRMAKGNGAYLLVQQLKAAGIKHVFYGNGTGSAPMLDAMVGDPDIHVILGTEENIVTGMASGYAMASNDPTFVNIHGDVGTAHQMLNMFNAKKDNLPLVVSSFTTGQAGLGEDGFESVDDIVEITKQFTRWSFEIPVTRRVPEILRNAIRISTTPPGGPVYLAIPGNVAGGNVEAEIYSKEYFTTPLRTKPDARQIEKSVKAILEAKKPFMSVGHEVWRSDAYDDVVKLAETAGLQTVQGLSPYTVFPTDHPLFIGQSDRDVSGLRTLRDADLMLNVGAHVFYGGIPSEWTLIDCRNSPDPIGLSAPTAIPVVADVRETTRAMIDALSQSMTAAQKAAAKTRIEETRVFGQRVKAGREQVLASRRDSQPIAWERVAYELNAALEPDAIITHEFGSAMPRTLPWFTFAKGKKETFGRTVGSGLGWAASAAVGIKMAKPDRQVCCMMGDGAMLMGQVEALWAAKRHEAPVLYVIFNNRSFNDTRMRLYASAPNVRKAGQDMGSYLGNPDVSFEQLAKGFEVAGATVTKPGEIAGAIQRGIRELKEGRPFLIDVVAERVGPLAESTWYPRYSVAERRTKQV